MFEEKLTGSSLGERRKTFNTSVSVGKVEELSSDNVSKLASKSQAEQLYMAALSRRFKNPQAVWQILKTGNDMTIKRVLQYKWFFETKTDFMNVDHVFGEIFPNISYRVRSKILSRLRIFFRDEDLAVKFYKKILEFYGREMAEKVLPACLLSFIKETFLKTSDFGVQCQTMIKIYKKDSKLAIENLDMYYKINKEKLFPLSQKNSPIDYRAIWCILVSDYPKEFVRIYMKYRPSLLMRFGYRNSVKLLKCDMKPIIKNEQFIEMLNIEALLDMVKEKDLDKFVINMMATKKEHFRYNTIKQFISRMKPKYRIYYIIKIYRAVYDGASFLDTDIFVRYNFAEHLDLEDRVAWALKKIANGKPADRYKEVYYLKFLSCDEAIPRYMEFSYSSLTVNHRLSLLENMVVCCKINSDTSALLKILKHVADRYRNEVISLRSGFLSQLYSSFPLDKLSGQHWMTINEMLQMMFLNNEVKKNYLEDLVRCIMTDFCRYRFENGLEIDSVIDMAMKYELKTLNFISCDIECDTRIMDAFLERYIVLITLKPMDDIFEANVLILGELICLLGF